MPTRNNSSSITTKAHIAGYPVEEKASDVDAKFNPKHWGYTLSNIEKAYTSDCPTLYGYTKKFGAKCAAAWILLQVTALYGSSTNKDVNIAKGMISFAESFAPQVKGFKLSELMIFFARYRAGRYDNSYASFDSRRIGNAFFKEFLPERNQDLAKIHRHTEQQAVEDRRFVPPEGYTSLQLYHELKELAEKGDETASELLRGNVSMTAEELKEFLILQKCKE